MPDGEITAVKFAEIMKVLRGHKLSPFVREYLLTVRLVLSVSYPVSGNGFNMYINFIGTKCDHFVFICRLLVVRAATVSVMVITGHSIQC